MVWVNLTANCQRSFKSSAPLNTSVRRLMSAQDQRKPAIGVRSQVIERGQAHPVVCSLVRIATRRRGELGDATE